MGNDMNKPTVFISYSHDSKEHSDRVLELSDQLISEGVDGVLDQYEEAPAEGWPRWMDKHIRKADYVLMICTEVYYKRVMGGDYECGHGRARTDTEEHGRSWVFCFAAGGDGGWGRGILVVEIGDGGI